MSFPYIIQGDNVVIVLDNKPYTINRTHIGYQKLVDAIKADDWDSVRDLIEPKKVVVSYSRGKITIDNGEMLWQGQVFNSALSRRMIEMLEQGFPIDPMVEFMHNLMQNPSKRAVDELYGFLEKNNLPITPDGHFLAYKKVRDNYMDCHTGTMNNSVGSVVEMLRNQVDDNKDNTCSQGLHFCSQEYLRSFGGERTVILKINPRDVVSIPSDYNNSKGRCCRYEVVGEIEQDRAEQAFNRPVQSNATGSYKTGTSEFYRGYSDGYMGRNYSSSGIDYIDYNEGYEKGSADREDSRPERYRYVGSI